MSDHGSYFRKMKLVTASSCRFCSEDEETLAHIVSDSGPLRTKRKRNHRSYMVDITDISSMNFYRILEYIKAIDLEKDF